VIIKLAAFNPVHVAVDTAMYATYYPKHVKRLKDRFANKAEAPAVDSKSTASKKKLYKRITPER
jgi:hypothetical protein